MRTGLMLVTTLLLSVPAREPAFGAQTGDEAMLVDRETFLRDLRADRPELAAVEAALDKDDLDAAGKAYVAYFRQKELKSPLWTDWSVTTRDANRDTSKADALLAGHMWDGYNVYEVPETGIDWRECPLVCLTRFPIFPTLRTAIFHRQDPRYVRFAVDHILQYMEAWPLEEFVGKGTQGFVDDYTVIRPWHWCMMPQRLGQVAQTLDLLRAYPQVTDDELLAILHRMYRETIYIRLHMKEWVDRRHNGGLGYILGMAHACKLFEDFRVSDEWAEYNAALLTQYIDQSFYPDGQCIEMTTAYSASVAQQVQHLASLVTDREGIRAAKPTLRAMVDWAIGLSKPTGKLPSFGDLYAGHVSRSMHPPLLDWLDVPYARSITDRAEAPLPPHTVWPAPDDESWAGYYAMRSDWTKEALYLCIDAGPWGTSHRHGDKLSFVVSAHGADFIIDPSSTKYRNNEPDALISTQAASFLHNTVTVDGVDEFLNGPNEIKEPLDNRWEHGDDYTLFEGSYSFRHVKPVDWKRRVVFVGKSYWLLQDVLTGDQETAAIEQNFQFEKDTEIEFDGTRTVATAQNGARLLLIPFVESMQPTLSLGDQSPHTTYWPSGKPRPNTAVKAGKDTVPPGRGWTGRSGKKLLPAPAVTYVGEVELPAMLTMALVPVAPGKDAKGVPGITSQTGGQETVWTLPTDGGVLRLVSAPDGCSIAE